MVIRTLLIGLLTCLFLACQEFSLKEDYPSLIDKEKIDAATGHDISHVLFDHLYVVVDSLTYEKLTHNNNWRNTYASMDAGLPDFQPIKEGSSNCYLRGHQHSIEILSPNNTFNEPVGKSGIGFSIENKGEHFHLGVKPKLRASKNALLNATETVKMPLQGKERTWFKAFYTNSPGTALHTWFGFYNPAFLDHLKGETHTRYSREAFIETAYAEHKLFHSVGAIRLRCTPNDFNRIAQELAQLKCQLVEQNGEAFTIVSGDIEIVIEQSTEIKYSRITQITCNLNEEDHSISTLGNLTITNQGKISVWDFDQLHKNNTK